MTAQTIRDWRGVKIPLSRCSDDDLVSLLKQTLITTERIRHFANAVQAELIAREQVTVANNTRWDAWAA